MLGSKASAALYWVIAVGVAVVWLIATVRPDSQSPAPKVIAAPAVDVVALRLSQHPVILRTQGNVRSIREVELIPQVSGRIDHAADAFVAGGAFAAGEPLLFIEDSDYRIAIRRAEAGLADARQLLAVEKGRARQAAREWRDLGDAEANDLFLRKPQLASAEAALAAAQANLDKAQLDFSRTQLSLPFAGRVVSKRADRGQFVVAGASLASVYSSEAAELRLPLTARQWHDLDSLQAATATAIARYGDLRYQWQAELVRREAVVDKQTRQYYVVARIDDAFQSSQVVGGPSRPVLALDQFVEVEIQLDWPQAGFRVPRAALHAPQQLWLADEKDRLQFLDVELLHADDDWLIVRPREGEVEEVRLITSPLRLPTAGMPLSVSQREP